MTTLYKRMTEALGKREKADLYAALRAEGCKISRVAVSKWFKESGERSQAIKAEYVFAVARFLGVNAEWLALGRGPKDGKAPHNALPPHRMALIQAYGDLPSDVRAPIRALIETLRAAVDEKYFKFERDLEARTLRAKRETEKA